MTADVVPGRHGKVGKRQAFWPLVIEKAYAEYKGGIDELNEGNAGEAILDLTTMTPIEFDPRDESVDYILGKLAEAKLKKWPVTLLTPDDDGLSQAKVAISQKYGLFFNHYYAVLDVDVPGKRVKLFNAWGSSHPNTRGSNTNTHGGWVKVETIRAFFEECTINSIPPWPGF